MQKQKQFNELCIDGRCPAGVDDLRKIGLTPTEKRAIFFVIKDEIFKQKQLLKNLPLF